MNAQRVINDGDTLEILHNRTWPLIFFALLWLGFSSYGLFEIPSNCTSIIQLIIATATLLFGFILPGLFILSYGVDRPRFIFDMRNQVVKQEKLFLFIKKTRTHSFSGIKTLESNYMSGDMDEEGTFALILTSSSGYSYQLAYFADEDEANDLLKEIKSFISGPSQSLSLAK